jgi:histidinol-phosphate/aromatic aminotransferase/cobyric acid decarboxylase-like protein
MKISQAGQLVREVFLRLKEKSGSHSPSVDILMRELDVKIKVDACFLSNPYATELFIDEFKKRFACIDDLISIFENYPPQNNDVAKWISKAIGVSTENILVGNGAQEIIEWLLLNYASKSVALPIPTYSSYYESVKKGVVLNYFELSEADNFRLDLVKYQEFVRATDSRIAVIINPNNPNGDYVMSDDVRTFCANNRHLDLILIDDSFSHFAYETIDLDLISNNSLINEFDNVVIIKSMSKDFGIAGLRAGYAVLPTEYVQAALANGFLWNSNGFACAFFEIMSDDNFAMRYEIVRKKYIMNTILMKEELQRIKHIRLFHSKSNFFLIKVDEIDEGAFGFNLLANHGVYVRNCNDKVGLGAGYYRIASRTFEENQSILKAILCEISTCI